MCEVDVFEHPRICDELSHLVATKVILQSGDFIQHVDLGNLPLFEPLFGTSFPFPLLVPRG